MKRITEKPSDERSIVILLHLLRNRNRKFKVSDIEQWLNQEEVVTKRSVQRSLQKLVNTTGSPVVEKWHGREKLYFIEPDFRWNIEIPIQKNSVLALFLLKRLQPFLANDKRLHDDLSDALKKIAGEIDDEIFDDLDQHLEENLLILGQQSLHKLKGDILDLLLHATIKKKRITIEYQGGYSDKKSTHDICPLQFFMANNELYLAGLYDEKHTTAYYFKICRILSVSLQDIVFSITSRQQKKIREHLKQSFGILDDPDDKIEEVELEFPPWFYRLLSEKQIHPTQKISVKKDKTTVIKMKSPVGTDLVHFVLGWADIVKIVKPKSLKDMVKEAIGKFQKNND